MTVPITTTCAGRQVGSMRRNEKFFIAAHRRNRWFEALPVPRRTTNSRAEVAGPPPGVAPVSSPVRGETSCVPFSGQGGAAVIGPGLITAARAPTVFQLPASGHHSHRDQTQDGRARLGDGDRPEQAVRIVIQPGGEKERSSNPRCRRCRS